LERGKIIAIEGIESSGKSTHAQALRSYLEDQGYGVIIFGLQMSKLMAEAIARVKKEIVFQRRTLFLAYLTDLADQVENVVKPAIDSGFIAIADSYTLTLEAWGLTRGLEKDWMDDVLAVLPKPSVSLSLISPPIEIMRRIIRKRGFLDPLSENVDLCVNNEIFSSYKSYINKFQSYLKNISTGKNIITRKKIEEVNEEIAKYVMEAINFET
jgi:dTMP kinase